MTSGHNRVVKISNFGTFRMVLRKRGLKSLKSVKLLKSVKSLKLTTLTLKTFFRHFVPFWEDKYPIFFCCYQHHLKGQLCWENGEIWRWRILRKKWKSVLALFFSEPLPPSFCHFLKRQSIKKFCQWFFKHLQHFC